MPVLSQTRRQADVLLYSLKQVGRGEVPYRLHEELRQLARIDMDAQAVEFLDAGRRNACVVEHMLSPKPGRSRTWELS